MIKSKILLVSVLLGSSLLFLTLNSCNNNVGVNPQSKGTSLNMLADMSSAPGNNTNSTIVITSAKFLIEFVRLEKEMGRDDADLKEGPFEVFINLDGTLNEIALSSVPPGTYNEVHYKIHKHQPNETIIDPDFGPAGVVGYSGIITGTFNGVPFVYRTAINVSQEIDIDPPLVVQPTSADVATNITLVVNPKMWFVSDGQMLDPLNPDNQQMIDETLKASFRVAFLDDDKNGAPDNDNENHGGHGHGHHHGG